MEHPELVEYIRTALKHGKKPDEVRDALLSGGWQASLVDAALGAITLQEAAALPVPPPPMPTETLKPAPVIKKPARTSVASPYSMILAIILFFSILILFDHILHDVTDTLFPVGSTAYQTDSFQTNEVMLRAALTLAFWGAAFGVYMGLRDRRQQFSVLTTPYYLVAGIFLIFLLIDIFAMLFDKNAIFGVYASLATVIIVLTAAVFGLQKYWHKSPTPNA